MQIDVIQEARRQIEICNACRYCEGYCSVFPAISRERSFADLDVIQLANLCHNCRSCYYACQFTPPHEFDLNLPGILAEVRGESWQDYAYPKVMAKLFQTSGTAIVLAGIFGFGILLWLAKTLDATTDGPGFYGMISHNMMVAIFVPAFILPLLITILSQMRYWRSVGGGQIMFADIWAAFGSLAIMKDLAGGHGEGCNFEDEDRFSNSRRWLHQMVLYGFLLCFAATSVATIMHYAFGLQAPYGLFSPPKLFGLTGGTLLSLGTLAMFFLKLKAAKNLSDPRVWSGEAGFILLLFFLSTSGMALYMFGDSGFAAELLALHLGAVLCFFLITPYCKMAHGFYRLTALVKDNQIQRNSQ